MELKRIVEAIFFSSPRPLTLKNLEKKLEVYPADEINDAINSLIDEYANSERAMEIVQVSHGYQMRTKIEYRDWVKRFVKEKDIELTRPMLEAIAIIAYKQPITKREIDRLRGVDSSRIIKHLLDRRLIEMAGRNDDIGSPIVFRTTDKFLELFGLKDLSDLPTYKEIESFES
ncbi:MAG TPA: SMC-Scp complex subunit ScpB [Deltaproteobacteria bacterium]|nr:SMC-Scp complex subunit ScpB [Deltaproteobacteria bacterium]